MPRQLIQAPHHDRRRSLGWLACAWMEYFVRHGPGSVQGQPVQHGDEFTLFVVDCYALGDEPGNNHMLYDSVFFSRPKGADKSGLGARLALFEALGPARFSGRYARGGEVYTDPWGMGFRYVYAAGEPMGRPVTAPFIRCMATEQNQVGNVYKTIRYNLTDEGCPLSQIPGVEAGLERALLPFGGEIQVSTASSNAKEGGRETFVIFDETWLYLASELHEMYDSVTGNLRKRKKIDGTWYLETSTMFAPGAGSIAEKTYAEASALAEGRKKKGRHRLLYDHRWGEVKDLADEEALREAIFDAFGEAAGWNDIDGIVDEFYDTRKDPLDTRRKFLNAQTSTSDSWLAAHEWDACGRPDKALQPKDVVTLGFDGALTGDATCLVACRVADRHIELLACYEPPDGPEGDDWEVDREAVDADVRAAMKTYTVVGFYADPPHWKDYLDAWHKLYAAKMTVRSTEKRPLEFWTNRPTIMVSAVLRFWEAVKEERLSFTPAADRTGDEQQRALTLRRHVLNARRRLSKVGINIHKEHPHSKKRIDAAMAAVLAYEAAQAAVAAGAGERKKPRYRPKRLR